MSLAYDALDVLAMRWCCVMLALVLLLFTVLAVLQAARQPRRGYNHRARRRYGAVLPDPSPESLRTPTWRQHAYQSRFADPL